MDSPKVQSQPGKIVDLKPTVAPDAKSAAQYYPANYWYALLKVPERKNFPAPGRWQRHLAQRQEPGPVDPPHQDR